MKVSLPTTRSAATIGALLAATGLGATAPAAAQTALEPAAETSTRSTAQGLASFDDAMTHYERCHWPQAYSQLAALADAEHPHAARIALLMARHGPTLYGTRFEVSAQQRGRWLLAASTAPWTLAHWGTD